MWLYIGLILLGVVLGVAGLLILIRLDLLPRFSRTAVQTRRPPTSPDPQALYETARDFLCAAETAFGSREAALNPTAWVNPSGKNFIPKALKNSHAALKEAFKAAGKRRTPSGVHLVQTALKLVQDHNRTDSRAPGAELPKITFAEGEGMQTS